MRAGWLVPGLILMLIVGLLLFIPLPYPEGHGVSQSNPLILYCPQVLPSSQSSSAYCLNGVAPFAFFWTGGSSSTWVEVVPCKNFDCSDVSKLITPTPQQVTRWGAVGTGASGSFTVWAPTNVSLLVFTNSTAGITVNVTLNSMPEFQVLWEVFAIVGMAVSLVGLMLPPHPRPKRRLGKRPAPASAPEADEEEGPPQAEGGYTEYPSPEEYGESGSPPPE